MSEGPKRDLVARTPTGHVRQSACASCGRIVEHVEEKTTDVPDDVIWSARPHNAPCGAKCAGGGVVPFEVDVHGMPIGILGPLGTVRRTGTCPRCDPGEVISENPISD